MDCMVWGLKASKVGVDIIALLPIHVNRETAVLSIFGGWISHLTGWSACHKVD